MLSASPLLYLLFIKSTCGLGTVNDPGDRNENVVREVYWMGQVPQSHTGVGVDGAGVVFEVSIR